MEKCISVIIPCYNAENYIDRCFQSLLNQNIGINRLEIIFVDDASTDGTWQKLSNYEASYPDSVILIHCEENGRQGKARNIGIQYAACPYIAFVDADDWLEPDMYFYLYEKALTFNCEIVCCDYMRDDGLGNTAAMGNHVLGDYNQTDRLLLIDTPEKRASFLMAGSMQHSSCNKLIRRDLVVNHHLSFPEMLAYEDSYFCTLLYFYVTHVYISTLPLYHYYVNSSSTVLRMDMPHHHDILTVNILKWEAFGERRLLDSYRDVLEFDFLTYCYLSYLKVLFLRFTKLPYHAYLQLKEETLKRIPHYENNPYIPAQITPFNQILLELLHKDVSPAQLEDFAAAARRHWNCQV